MTREPHATDLRRRAASYRKIAATRQSAEAKAIYLAWAIDLERHAAAMARAA